MTAPWLRTPLDGIDRLPTAGPERGLVEVFADDGVSGERRERLDRLAHRRRETRARVVIGYHLVDPVSGGFSRRGMAPAVANASIRPLLSIGRADRSVAYLAALTMGDYPGLEAGEPDGERSHAAVPRKPRSSTGAAA
jgi:hypothetical protein